MKKQEKVLIIVIIILVIVVGYYAVIQGINSYTEKKCYDAIISLSNNNSSEITDEVLNNARASCEDMKE